MLSEVRAIPRSGGVRPSRNIQRMSPLAMLRQGVLPRIFLLRITLQRHEGGRAALQRREKAAIRPFPCAAGPGLPTHAIFMWRGGDPRAA